MEQFAVELKWKIAKFRRSCKGNVENNLLSIFQTVDRKVSAVLRNSCFVSCVTSVISTMPSFDSIDIQHGNFRAIFRNHYAVIRRQIFLNVHKFIKHRPPNFDRHVAFCDDASGCDGFVEIQFFFPKRKRTDLR